MRERLVFKINGTDFSQNAQRYGFTFGIERREGANSGYMLDGSRTVDLVAVKRTLQVRMNPLSAIDLKNIMTEISGSTVLVQAYDPVTGSNVQGEFIPDAASATYAITTAGNTRYFTGMVLTFVER